MTSTFASDLEVALASLNAARANLVTAVQPLTLTDLERARRGGWPLHRILEHVIEAENLYVAAVATIRKLPLPSLSSSSCAGEPADEILCRLDASRRALLNTVNGVTEDDFYRIETLGREEYSVLSILENAAHHDEEHTRQIAATIAA
jgi:hypothetical protein